MAAGRAVEMSARQFKRCPDYKDAGIEHRKAFVVDETFFDDFKK